MIHHNDDDVSQEIDFQRKKMLGHIQWAKANEMYMRKTFTLPYLINNNIEVIGRPCKHICVDLPRV